LIFPKQSSCEILEASALALQAAHYSADGRFVLSGLEDHTLRLFDVASGQEMARWIADVPIRCCGISPNTGYVVAGDAHGEVHFLSIEASETNAAEQQ
jgi:WD40 repeat protein